jgi:hypothetical protein
MLVSMIVSGPFQRLLLRHSLALLACGFCIGMALVTSVFAQDEGSVSKTAEARPARSMVRGRLIFADSEQPLRRAIVRLRKDFNRDFLKRTISGKNGGFEFEAVPAGTYYVDVEAPGVVSLASGVSFSNLGFSIDEEMLQQVTVDGNSDIKTEIRVTKGATIAGRISYVDGEPATHARIVLYRKKGQTPVLFFTDSASFTDDRGAYRIEGLPSGNYFVGAVENNSGGEKTLPRDGAGLITAYHPAALSVREATTVSVDAGVEAREVNIKFDETPHRLSGELKWKQGDTPIKHATVFLRRTDDPQMELDRDQFLKMVTPVGNLDNDDLMMQHMFFFSLLSSNSPYVEADESGRWSYEDVSPGTYVVTVVAPVPVSKPTKPKPANENDLTMFEGLREQPDFSEGILRGSAEVTIKDEDVDDLPIDLSEGASIGGSVVIEGSTESTTITVNAISDRLPSLFSLPAYVKQDRTFVLESVPAGAVRLDVSEPRAAKYYVRSMTGKGLDLLKEPLVLEEGEQVSGVRIVLATDLANIEGRVISATDGRSVPGAGVVLLPVDIRKWVSRSATGLARADAEGRFSIRIPPGEYLVLAWSVANEPAVPLETYVREHAETAGRITLQPGQTKVIDIPAQASEKKPRQR